MAGKYHPRKGDRVRVVLEGEVDTVSGGEFYVVNNSRDGSWVYLHVGNVVSVEKIGPMLPTTPGSVIRWLDAFEKPLLVLDEEDRWGNHAYAPGPDSLINFEVIFDAGAK